MTNVTICQLLEVGAHFGHQVRFWNPKMAPYIFGVKSKVHIINLEKTLELYQQAVNYLSSVAAKKGKILFVGTKQQVRGILREEAKRCRMPYVDYRWLGGMLTNYKTIRQSLKRLQDLEALRDSVTFARMSKKEALAVMREITKLESSLGGIREMGGLPEAILVLDVGNEEIAVSEARKLKIPIVGVVDTNNSPDCIDYVIPGNDDSVRAVTIYLKGIVDAIITAQGTIVEEEQIAAKEEHAISRGDKKVPLTKKRVFKKGVVTASDTKKHVTVKAGVVGEVKKEVKAKTTRGNQVPHKVTIIKKVKKENTTKKTKETVTKK